MSGSTLSPKFSTVALQRSMSSASVHSGRRIETPGNCAFNINSLSLSQCVLTPPPTWLRYGQMCVYMATCFGKMCLYMATQTSYKYTWMCWHIYQAGYMRVISRLIGVYISTYIHVNVHVGCDLRQRKRNVMHVNTCYINVMTVIFGCER